MKDMQFIRPSCGRQILLHCAMGLLASQISWSPAFAGARNSAGPAASASAAKARSPYERAVLDLIIANRILAHQGVVDAYGHVSMRHPSDPQIFLMARSRSPGLVEADDIMQFRLDGSVIGDDRRAAYIERHIHAAIYRERSEINAVVHAHASEVLPFTVSSIALRPVIHSAGVVSENIPLWDIRDRFGDTNLLVSDEDQGGDLAQRMAGNNVVLMRGHGFAAAGVNLIEVLRVAVYLRENARVLLEALKLGEVIYLSPGELDAIRSIDPASPALRRAWEFWATEAGVADLLQNEAANP